jgi:hypothetical protein
MTMTTQRKRTRPVRDLSPADLARITGGTISTSPAPSPTTGIGTSPG